MSTAKPTWIVLARDLSGTVTVAGQPRVAAALILDADTGLVRGLSMDDTIRPACAAAARMALTAPAGTLPARPPGTVVYDHLLAEEILQALHDALPDPAAHTLLAGPVPAEAEDIFDSLVGHLAGRHQPTDPPTPDDWLSLYAATADYARRRPWRLWSDADHLDLVTDLDGDHAAHRLIVLGGEGIQRGLNVYPQDGRPDWSGGPEGQPSLPVGALLLWLDPIGEMPPEALAKARRYGWPEDADLAPLLAVVGPEGLGDLDREAARRLTLALTAVVAHQGPRRGDTTAGTVTFPDGPDGTVGKYTISDGAPVAAALPPAPLAPLRTARLRVTMREVTPTVVRVVDVPSKATLEELHDILQVAIGWTDSHLHEFETADGIRYAHPDLDVGDDVRDEAGATLQDLTAAFTYRYDFGDSWKHDVEVLGRGDAQPGCVAGEGACPPEDCGGAGGYAELLEALADDTHPDHDHLRGWAGHWSPTWNERDRLEADALVRATVGLVPTSVRLLLDQVGDQVTLTRGGRFPRAFVRAVQERQPDWSVWDRPAHAEEDLPALAELHRLMRRVGLFRVTRGVLTPTKAAADDLQVVRRLRRVFEPDGFDDILAGTAVAHLAARGPLPGAALAALTHPWLERWSMNGRQVTPHDVDIRLATLADLFRGLDLVRVDRDIWHPGPSAESLLPRAVALGLLFRRVAP